MYTGIPGSLECILIYLTIRNVYWYTWQLGMTWYRFWLAGVRHGKQKLQTAVCQHPFSNWFWKKQSKHCTGGPKKEWKSTYLTFEQFFLRFNKLDKFLNIAVNFEGKKMVDHILEFTRLLVFGVNRDTTKLYLRNNPARNKDNVEVVI